MNHFSLDWISRFGVVVDAHLGSPHIVEELKAVAAFAYGLLGSEKLREGISSVLKQPHDQWGGIGMSELRNFLEDHKQIDLSERFTKAINFVAGPFDALGYILQLQYCFFRSCTLNKTGNVGWHCDAEAASMLLFEAPALTAWMPLQPVGHRWPSLELMIGSHRVMRARPDLKVCTHREDAWVDALGGERLIPMVNEETLGTAAIFDQYTLHRTQQLEANTPRLSCEFRFTKQ